MSEEHLKKIRTTLQKIPKGTLQIKTHIPQNKASTLESMLHCPDGNGIIETYRLFQGIEISHTIYQANTLTFHHIPLKSVMQINHCRYGRIGWKMKDELSIYLGTGDLSIHMMEQCTESTISLPLGYYEGIAITVDLKCLSENTPEILKDADINGKRLYDKFCTDNKAVAMPASDKIDHIFSELYNLPQKMYIPYYKLKVQELLLFLDMFELYDVKKLNQCVFQQTETVKQIHEQLTNNLSNRFTIDELSRKYLINTSSLKTIFKMVYGMPIAAYMKEYRIKYAAHMLIATDKSIAEIAASVGYESQSKFTAAFKDVFKILPTAYRKQYSNSLFLNTVITH